MVDFDDNAPIPVAITLSGWLETDPSDRFTDTHAAKPPALRATSIVVLDADEPIVFRGRPTMPAYRVDLGVTVTATQGTDHIHAIADPDPVWDPDTGTWAVFPGPSGVGDCRWTVQTLLDPDGFVTGSYPLGDRSADDETTEIDDAATEWAPDVATGGPSWHSAWPFKPTVCSRDSVVEGGKTVHHPKGVLFSSGNVAHMWLDMGEAKAQPFSWVIVAIPLRSQKARQGVLDAGRDPYDVGFPALDEDDLGDDHTVADGLSYRTSLSVAGAAITMSTSANGKGVSAASFKYAVRPRMYACVFDGPNSILHVRDRATAFTGRGTVSGGTGFDHRYYVLGRPFGLISQDSAAEMLVFEARFWHSALDTDDLADQYAQLSSTYRFTEYGLT